jgi:hypothetical protein
VFAGGKLYVLDEESNKVLGDRINEQNWTATQDGWMRVTATGTAKGKYFSANKVYRVQ